MSRYGDNSQMTDKIKSDAQIRSEVFSHLIRLQAENRLRDVKDRKDGLDGFLKMRKYYLRLHHNAGRYFNRTGDEK